MSFFHRHKKFATLLLVFCVLLAGSLIAWYEFKYYGKFYPHTIVAGEDVGGKTYQQVLDEVQAVSQSLERDGFLVQIASSTVKIPAFSQGLTPDTVVEYFTLGDWKKELQKAYQEGRHGALLERAGQQLNLAFSPGEVRFPYVLQEDAVKSLVARELDSLLKKKSEAELVSTGGLIEIAPEVDGETVNQDEIMQDLKRSLGARSLNSISAVVRKDPAVVTAKRLGLVTDFARTLAQKGSLTVKFDGFSSYVSGPRLATWLTLKNEPGISLTVDRDKLEAYVRASVDPYVGGAPRNSRFEMRDGVLVEIIAGASGQGVNIDSFYGQLSSALANMYVKSAFASAPADAVAPIRLNVALTTEVPRVTKETISTYGIKDLVGSVNISFKGSSADRIHNIATGLSKINGLLIAPGQEFSALTAIGSVTKEDGYVEEYVIKADSTTKEYGGGLCQIATTLFRLALNAGLPVTERVNHRYVVGYYGPGLDATIYDPHPDLKFLNDTRGYLLLQGRIVDSALVLELYGQKDSRTATVSKPVFTDRIPPPPAKYIPSYDMALGVQKCTERAIYGLTADATYTVTYPDGHIAIQNFHSVYQPWAQVCLVGISLTAPRTPNSFEGVH